MTSRRKAPVCSDCGRECPARSDRGWRVSHGRCEGCRARQLREQAAVEAVRAGLPPLKASDSGYGAYGVVRMGVAS